MDLDEFREELGEPLFERLVDEGFDSARKVIEAKTDVLLQIEGLTEQKVNEIKSMMMHELEEADVEEEGEETEEGIDVKGKEVEGNTVDAADENEGSQKESEE